MAEKSKAVSASAMVKSGLQVLDPKKRIETCHSGAKQKFRLLVLGLAVLGYGQVRVICGRRTFEEQCELYGRGRVIAELVGSGCDSKWSAPHMPVVSWCKPKASKHVAGLAVDVSFDAYKGVVWHQVGRLADDLGLTWGGNWSVKDFGHFEV